MSTHAAFWDYLSPSQKDLIREGSYLYQEIYANNKYAFVDYSFVVFPFAKAYEGFLKKFLLEMRCIGEEQYNSDYIRLGRLLSPDLADTVGSSIYSELASKVGDHLTDMIWNTWKFCRNQVFHYYPHNYKSLPLNEAENRVHMILKTIKYCHQALLSYQDDSSQKKTYSKAPKYL